jgi:hypothetical protein
VGHASVLFYSLLQHGSMRVLRCGLNDARGWAGMSAENLFYFSQFALLLFWNRGILVKLFGDARW